MGVRVVAKTIVPGLLLVSVSFAGPLVGQTQEQSEPAYRWQLEGLQQAFCVDFLMDTALARKNVEKALEGYLPLPASSVANLHPALTGVIRRDSSYRSWVPSRLCLLGGRAVDADGRRFSEEGGEPGRQMVGFWGIAAAPEELLSDPADPGLMVAPVLFGSNHRLTRAAEVAGLEVDRFRENWGMVPESLTEERYAAKIMKAELRWDGHLAGSVPDSGFTFHASFMVRGKRNVPWLGRVELYPDAAQAMVGAFTVHGKDDLSKALHNSPIRMLTPMMWGGEGQFLFYR